MISAASTIRHKSDAVLHSCPTLASILCALLVPLVPALVRSADCDRNGVDDAVDLEPRDVGYSVLGRMHLPQEAADMVFIDLEGDRDLDILALGNHPVTLIALRNDGSGHLGEPVVSRFEGTIAMSLRMAAGDIDGDQDVDLAFPALTRVIFLLNDGSGTFTGGKSVPIGSGPRDAVLADLDGDDDLDLAVTLFEYRDCKVWLYGNEVEVFLNDGAARFRSWGTVTAGERPDEVLMADLDSDGLPEVLALTDEGELSILRNLTRSRLALDRDRDGVPDVCERAPFRRGDWNQDGRRDLTDAVALLAWLFEGAESPGCEASGDVDDDGRLGITDPIRLLRYLFLGDAPPPEPFESCGEDPTADSLPCESFPTCG